MPHSQLTHYIPQVTFIRVSFQLCSPLYSKSCVIFFRLSGRRLWWYDKTRGSGKVSVFRRYKQQLYGDMVTFRPVAPCPWNRIVSTGPGTWSDPPLHSLLEPSYEQVLWSPDSEEQTAALRPSLSTVRTETGVKRTWHLMKYSTYTEVADRSPTYGRWWHLIFPPLCSVFTPLWTDVSVTSKHHSSVISTNIPVDKWQGIWGSVLDVSPAVAYLSLGEEDCASQPNLKAMAGTA